MKAGFHNSEGASPRGEGLNWGNGCQDPCFTNVTICIIWLWSTLSCLHFIKEKSPNFLESSAFQTGALDNVWRYFDHHDEGRAGGRLLQTSSGEGARRHR